MKARWIAATALAALALILAGGVAIAASRPDTPAPDRPQAAAMTERCAATHDSAAMRQMHATMPAQQQAQCDAMHARMQQMHASMPHPTGAAGQHMTRTGTQQMMQTGGYGPGMMSSAR